MHEEKIAWLEICLRYAMAQRRQLEEIGHPEVNKAIEIEEKYKSELQEARERRQLA